MKENKHVAAIPQIILNEVQERIEELRKILEPYGVALTALERQKIAKMGPKTLDFVEKSYEFAQQNPKLCPPYLDMQAFAVDYSDAHGLWKLQNQTLQLHETVSDTAMAAGSEAYAAALVFYNSVKTAVKQDIPGARAVYEELRRRFPRGRHRKASGNGDEAVEEI